MAMDKRVPKEYEEIKKLIAADTSIRHYDPALPLVLAADASPYGLGAVLSHSTNEGERPICFISRSLTKAEQNYSQLDREGLSIVRAVKKLSDYLHGRHFTIVTDNRPIAAILSQDKGTPPMTAARLQRWASFLSSYDYQLTNRNTKEHGNLLGISKAVGCHSHDAQASRGGGSVATNLSHISLHLSLSISQQLHSRDTRDWFVQSVA